MRFLCLLVLTQLAGCVDWCPSDAVEPYAARNLAISIQNVEDVAAWADGEILVVSRRLPTATVVTRIGRFGEEAQLAVLPELTPTDVAPSLHVGDDQWWFSRMGFHDPRASVFFLTGGAAPRETRHSIDGFGTTIAWLPIRGVEPRGLLISAGADQPALRVTEITPSGPRAIAALPWWQTSSLLTMRHDSRWSAVSLDGRYVIAAIDGASDEARLRVRTIGGESREADIACKFADQAISTAVAPAGTLAIVGLSAKNEIVVALLNVDHPESARCRTLSAPGEAGATPGYGSPTVAWANDRFIVAWLRDDGVVRATELAENASHRPIIDIATGAEVSRPLRQLLRAEAETVSFTWRGRDGHIYRRELPHAFTASILGVELQRMVCSGIAAISRAAERYLRQPLELLSWRAT